MCDKMAYKKPVNKLRIGMMEKDDLQAIQRHDIDFNNPPWTEKDWIKKWGSPDSASYVIRQNNKLGLSDIVACLITTQEIDGHDIKRIVFNYNLLYGDTFESNVNDVFQFILSNLSGKITMSVRERHTFLCKLFKKHQFTMIKYKKNAYKFPTDNGLIFQSPSPSQQFIMLD
jgi:hypothetical protein